MTLMSLIDKNLRRQNNVIKTRKRQKKTKVAYMKRYICQIIRSFMAHLQGFSDVRAKQEVITFERQPTFLRRSPALHFCMISFVSALSLEDFCLLLHLIGTSILKTSPQCRLVEKPFDLPGFAAYVSLLVAVFVPRPLRS